MTDTKNKKTKKPTTAKRGAGEGRAKAGKLPEPIPPSTVEMESKPAINRRFKGPSSKTLSLILEGSAKIPSYDYRAVNHLARLVIDLQIFFGQERQDAAHFLFSVWTDAYRAPREYPQPHAYPVPPDALQPYDDRLSLDDMQAWLKQFQLDVNAAIKPKKRRGRKRKPLVTKLKELKEQGHTIREGCEMEILGFPSMDKDTQNILIRAYTEAVGKRTRRDRASQEAENDPDKL